MADAGGESTVRDDALSESPAGDGDEEEDRLVVKDRDELLRLCRLLEQHQQSRKAKSSVSESPFSEGSSHQHGADLVIHVQSGSQAQMWVLPAVRLRQVQIISLVTA